MNDFFDWKGAAVLLLGFLVSVLGWLGKDYAKRVRHLEEHAATNTDMEKRHVENRGRFDEVNERFDRLEDKIDTGITGTHQRIDKLFERLPERQGK